MKLVLDANVFISAFYWGGNSQKIINRISVGQDELYISNEILNEVAAVMARPKFRTDPEIIERYIRTIEKIGKKVFITGIVKGICMDSDDDDKIECGILSDSDYIITGDNDLLILENFQQIKIITINDFMKIISSANSV